MTKRLFVLVLLAVLMAAGCSNEIEAPGPVAPLPPRPETPLGLKAAVGDGLLVLSWTVNNPAAVIRYRLYFSDTASVERMRLLDSTALTEYTVRNLANGRKYYFQVAAVATSGLEGERCQMVGIAPGLFSISIASGRTYTRTRSVTVGLTAPPGTSLVQLSEDSAFAGAQWESYAASKNFELSDGDRMKTVYARFQMESGGSSAGFAADSIILDRIALIDSVTENSNGVMLLPGDVVRFSLYTKETGGEASVEVAGLGTITLYDDGCCGDRLAADGVYEFLYAIPVNTELTEAVVTGRFTDAAGNEAATVKATTRLNATFPPDPVVLSGHAASSREIVLDWTKTGITDFGSYRLYRKTTAGVDSSSFTVTTVSNAGTVTYTDTGLTDTTGYYYRLYVYDTRGNAAGSNEVHLTTLANQPPDTTVLAANLSGDSANVILTWLASTADDFETYRLLRSPSPISEGAAYNESLVVAIINTAATTTYTDRPAAGTYYYRLFIFDVQGASSKSHVVSITVP